MRMDGELLLENLPPEEAQMAHDGNLWKTRLTCTTKESAATMEELCLAFKVPYVRVSLRFALAGDGARAAALAAHKYGLDMHGTYEPSS